MFNWLFGNKGPMEVLMRDKSATETLIWQHPNTEFNTNTRVNLSLNEVAVFYDMTSGQYEVITQSKDLKTGNVPVLSRIPTALSGGVSKYQCCVYFIRTSVYENRPWGTSQPLGPFMDYVHKGMTYSLRMNGVYSFKIVDIDKILQFVDSDKVIDIKSFEENRIYGGITGMIYQLVTKVIQTLRLDFISAREFLFNCGPALKDDIQSNILDDMGLELVKFSIDGISLPDEDSYNKALQSWNEEAAMVEGLGIQGIQNYMVTHAMKIAETAAANGGAAGASAGIGIGVGAGIGGQLGSMINSIMAPLNQQISTPSAPGMPTGTSPLNGVPGSGPATGVSPTVPTGNPPGNGAGATGNLSQFDINRLTNLKQLFDKGIITQAHYDGAVAEILKTI